MINIFSVKKIKLKLYLICLVFMLLPGSLAACSKATPTAATTSTTAMPGVTSSVVGTSAPAASGYQEISAAAARDWLARDQKVLLLDVRTKEENLALRIPKSKLIPYDEIVNRQSELPADKNTPIIVYCRSGNRSKIAAEQLIKLGYTNVHDLGGINDWPYETEKG